MIEDLREWQKTFKWDYRKVTSEGGRTCFEYRLGNTIVAGADSCCDTANHSNYGWRCIIYSHPIPV
jgi:hypothetical protein